MLPHSSSIRDFYHFDDTKDNQRFFLIARPLWVVFKDVMYVSPPPISCLFFPSPFSSSFSPSHLHSTHAPPLCVLLLHLCSDYSSIDSHTDVAIGRCAELALDTHNQPCWCLWGTTTLLVMWSVVVHNRNTLLSTALLTGKAFSLVH